MQKKLVTARSPFAERANSAAAREEQGAHGPGRRNRGIRGGLRAAGKEEDGAAPLARDAIDRDSLVVL